MPLKFYKYALPVGVGLLLCSCSTFRDEEYENFIKSEEEKKTLSQFQKQIDESKKEKPIIPNKEKRCLQSLQSCKYDFITSQKLKEWECKIKDCEGHLMYSMNNNMDFSENVDILFNVCYEYQVKRDEYGNVVKLVQECHDSHNDLVFTKELFYTYTDSSRKNPNWQERKYSSMKSIIYGPKGVRLQERTSEYSDDRLEAKYVKRDYVNGALAQEEGFSFACSHDWFREKDRPQCLDNPILKNSWRTKIENGKILGKTYYSNWFKDILFTSQYEYNKDGSYKEKYSDGRIEKFDADGQKI